MCEITDWMIWLLLAGCGAIDWKKKSIPLWLLVVFGMTVSLSLFFCRERSARGTVGGIMVGLLLLLISKCTKEAIGYGDSLMILLLGMYLGGMRVLLVLFWASFLAGICSLFLLLGRKRKKKEALPFLPFLAVSYLGVLLT